MVSTLLSAWRKVRVVSTPQAPPTPTGCVSPPPPGPFCSPLSPARLSARLFARLVYPGVRAAAAGAPYDHALRRRSRGRASPIHAARSMRSHSVYQRRDAPHHAGARAPRRPH
eukprot:scaffold112623_cov105-Phaeocystis_antarctica.AAC.2